MDHQVAVSQTLSINRVDERAAARADHLVTVGGDARNRLTLVLAEGRLALPLEDLGDRAASHLLDDAVGVDEAQSKPAGDVAAERRFATTAKADQDEVIHEGPRSWVRGPRRSHYSHLAPRTQHLRRTAGTSQPLPPRCRRRTSSAWRRPRPRRPWLRQPRRRPGRRTRHCARRVPAPARGWRSRSTAAA